MTANRAGDLDVGFAKSQEQYDAFVRLGASTLGASACVFLVIESDCDDRLFSHGLRECERRVAVELCRQAAALNEPCARSVGETTLLSFPVAVEGAFAAGALGIVLREGKHITSAQAALTRDLTKIAESYLTKRDIKRRAELLQERYFEKIKQVEWYARRDPVTELTNRFVFCESLKKALGRNRPDGISVILLDLDGFKDVNDTHGHAAGDDCLRAVARKIGRAAKPHQVSRLGGDEFGIIVPAGLAETVATKIQVEMQAPFKWRRHAFRIGVSIGIGDGTRNAADLLRRADLALYAAKGDGRGVSRRFCPSMESAAARRLWQVEAIHSALNLNELEVYYQPKYVLRTGELAGVEALLRWRRADGVVVPPAHFSDVFQDAELSRRIDEFVVGRCIEQAKLWHEQSQDFGHIAVNLSPSHFRDPDFADNLIGKLSSRGVAPGLIEVEITENVFLSRDSTHIGDALAKLRAEGVRISLDDFGTGFASLTHLRSFPVDALKIDCTFTANLGRSSEDTAIVQAVCLMAQSLGIDVVAEGIETAGQAEVLRSLGCRFGQGFLFARPQPPDLLFPTAVDAAAA